MSGQLTDKYMDTLEQWIGTGQKTLKLLYSITRDGCNSATFHQRCDNQGPTVTVLYNQSQSIYGGYTSQSWTSGGTWINDNAAFLFKLQLNGKADEMKFGSIGTGEDVYDHANYGLLQENCEAEEVEFDSIGGGQDVFDHANYGPTFGAGHDLHTFTGKIIQRGGVFQLNGQMNIGNSYTNNGLQAAQINNGNMVVTELEVYKVTNVQRKKMNTVISTWRKSPSWDKKLLDDLAKDILAFKPLPELRMSAARLVMIGPVGAGKSSFYNTINSIFRGWITQRAGIGSAEQSLTTAYTPYKVRLRSGTSLNFRLCDTRGLEDVQGMDVVECSHLLDGHIPDFYEFNPATPINTKTKGFIHDPKTGDKVHCVLFILDATTLDVLSAKILQKIKEFKTIMNQKGLIQTLILTKVDKLCEESSKDISLVYKSQTVEKAVDKAANLLGIPRFNVFPVKNYENEMDLDENTSILALLTLRQILRFTEDYMENMLEKMEDRGAYGGDSDED